MTDFKLTSAKLTGTPGQSGWSQVHEFKPDDENKLKLRGHIVAVVSTGEQKEGVETVVAGRELLARLHEEYYGDTKITAFNALKKAIEKVVDEFSNIWSDVQISSSVFVNGVVYTAAGGGAEVSIFRDGMLATILKSKRGEVVAASGHPQEGDMLLLSTSGFFEGVGSGVIKAALESGIPEEAVEAFAATVHSRQNAGNLGLAVIRFTEETDIAPLEMEKDQKQQVHEEEPVQKTQSPPFLSGISSFIKSKLPDRRVYIRRGEVDVEDAQKRKTAISVGGLLLVLLLVSIVFGVRQAKIREEKASYESKITQARHELDEAKSLFTLNPERARELFASAQAIVSELESSGVKDTELDALKNELEQGRQSVLGEHEVNSEQFLDLTRLEGFSASFFASTVDAIYIYDENKKRIAEVIVDTKKTEVVVGPAQIDSPNDMTVYTDRPFLLEEDGIYEVGDARTLAVEKDWSDSAFIKAYAGNLYVLDKGSSAIYRFAGTDDGFGSRKDWLAPGIEPDFSNVVSWAIDGSIWILTSTGKIEKYTLGSPKIISISVSPPLANPAKIYTNEELSNVYLLEPSNRRVVVFDKDGAYVSQYSSEIIKDSINFTVSESAGKIILLTKDKLYSIALE